MLAEGRIQTVRLTEAVSSGRSSWLQWHRRMAGGAYAAGQQVQAVCALPALSEFQQAWHAAADGPQELSQSLPGSHVPVQLGPVKLMHWHASAMPALPMVRTVGYRNGRVVLR